MRKSMFVTMLLVAALALIFTQAMAAGPSSQASLKPVKTKVPAAVSTLMPDKPGNSGNSHAGGNVGKASDDSEVEETEQPEEPETPGHGNSNKPAKPEKALKNKPAKAQGKLDGRKVNYHGTVTLVGDDGSITLTLQDGTTVTLLLDPSSVIKIPSLKTGLAELKIGDKVTLRALVSADGTITILEAHVIPGKPVTVHRVGIVTSMVDGLSITVEGPDGQSSTFMITDTTKLLPDGQIPEIGAYVTIICPRDVTGGELTAAGIVVHPTQEVAVPLQ